MATHTGTNTRAGEFAPYRVGGAALETLGKNGYRECRRVSDEHMDVVGFAVELDQFDVQVDAHTAHGVLGAGEHGVGEQFAPAFGYEDEMGVEQRHAVAVAAVGRVSGHLYGCAVGKSYRMASTPTGEQPVGKPRARKRAKGAPTHVRSWPLRPNPTQCREIGIRFFHRGAGV